MKILNKELEIVKKRVNNVGYKLYTYDEVFEELMSDTDYINEEIEIFIFEAGEEYSFKKSSITAYKYDSVDVFRKDIEEHTVQSKTYKRPTAWSKKLYDYAKLNNFVFTFVIIDE